MFSIVIPLFNKFYSVKRCLDSVLSQTYKDYEIIVVNDGSTDNSLSILIDGYEKEIQSGLIKIIDQTNRGVSVARNNGVNFSKSEYICFLDADDEWLPDFLQKISNLIKKFPFADLYCLAHLVSKNSQAPIKPKHGLPEGFYGYVDDYFTAAVNGDVANSSKVCISKKALLNIGGFPEGAVTSEDLHVWIMLALNGKVACDMSYSTIVHQVSDDSRKSRLNSIPYPLFFFSKNKYLKRSKSLNRYLFSIFYIHFLHSLYHFRIKEARLRLICFLRVFI